MISPFFGEFMGTLVLVLLGDGVVANVLLKRSKAEGAGWMVIATGWCLAVMAGVVVAVACGSRDAYINPAVALAFAIFWQLPKVGTIYYRRDAGRIRGSRSCVASFSASLEDYRGPGAETRLLLHIPGDPQIRSESRE